MTNPFRHASTFLLAALTTAWIAGAFLALVCAGLVYQRITASSNDPWKSPQLLELKAQLQDAPRDEGIKSRIRDLDLKFRQRYVRRLVMGRSGGWLLLGGSIVFIAALWTVAEARRRPPLPQPDHDAGARALRHAAASRRAVGVTAGALGIGLVAIAFGLHSALDDPALAPMTAAAGVTTAPRAGPPLPPHSEFLANWPRFRGPLGGGAASSGEAPLKWDGKTGTGIVWKAPVPAPGFNSPIVWGERVFISGATAEKREIFCYDAATGQLRWQRAIEKVPGSPAESPPISEETGYAAPTMATDGRHAYAIFAHGDLAAVTFDGDVAWSKHLGVPHNPYGHATSLAIWDGKLLVQLDQGEGRPHNSRLIAIDGGTGRVLWEKPRSMASSWATPIVIETAGSPQIVTLGVPFVIGYALADGRELWRAERLDGEITPSPIFAGGRLLVIHPDNKMMAFKPEGTGDITESPLDWKAEDNIPDITSPVSNGELVFTVTSRGIVTCFDLADGKTLWEKDLQTEAHPSPVIAGNRLYVTCTNGTTIVAAAGREYQELARNELGEKVFASAAIVRGRMYVRGLKNLYCLGPATKPASP
ncbi:MAG: PQQ-binding-like beta-propeller repeat protein [Opitutaceae bacterium]|nr:PQQ-binding-like beta-propeller repeat protein [Opitutaceae bacterium]